jgi:hypothetical protein
MNNNTGKTEGRFERLKWIQQVASCWFFRERVKAQVLEFSSLSDTVWLLYLLLLYAIIVMLEEGGGVG